MENLENKSENQNKLDPSQGTYKPMIEGANLWAHFNVRCPGCNKLYRVDSREIKSTQPYFSCTACQVVFSFEFPPKQLTRVETRIVKVNAIDSNSIASSDTLNFDSHSESVPFDSSNKLLTHEFSNPTMYRKSVLDGPLKKQNTKSTNTAGGSASANAALVSCPKCGEYSPKLSKECIKCGVIFEKLENLPLDPKIGARPSLVRMWQELMRDYENLAKHLEFVDRCEDLEALPFAMSKYQELKSLQPQDALADEMFQMVWLKNFKLRAEKIPGVRRLFERTEGLWQKVIQSLPWARILRFSPYVVSSLLILIGISTPGARNLAGTGASLLFLSLGVLFLWKGRIHWKDLW